MNNLLSVDDLISAIKEYNPRTNSEIIKKKLYSPKLSPSTVSTESYLKARSNKGPIFMHNEAMTKYYFISQIHISSSMQKNSIDFMI